MIRAVIFDRDGTLLDFSGMFLAFVDDLHVRQGLSVPSDRDHVLSLDYWHSIQEGRKIGDILVMDHLDHIPQSYMDRAQFFPGTSDAIRSLSDAGMRLAIASAWVATDQTKHLLARERIADCFASVLTRDDLEAEAIAGTSSSLEVKLALVQRSLKELDLDPWEVAIVGDAPVDIQAGKALSMRTIAVRTGNFRFLGHHLEVLAPDHVVDSVAELNASQHLI
ncbi:HAD hydrolase-like protein [Pararhizobium sp. LjRoot235]|uniref:HAD family hydrolase n=1 Tax=Pararhizobium sp. LjRoot235 TaxID=3342291 RepID=UPI003ECE141E